MYACAHLQLYMIISPADQNVRISRIRGCMPEYLHLRKHIAAAPLLPVHSRLTHARLELRAPTLMRHAASAVLQLCLSFIIAFSLGHTLGISTKSVFIYLRPLNRRILSYFNLHFTTRSRPGKSLITTAGEYFPESFNILRRSSPWSWPISTSRKPSGFRKSAAFSTMVL